MALNSDAVLIQQIRQGDQVAWNRLIERYEGRLFAFAESRLHDHSVSEDVVQETFIGFLNSLPNFDDRRELQTWLFSIAAYKVTDQLRKRIRRQVHLAGDPDEDLLDNQFDREQLSASSIARQDERKVLEETALTRALQSTLRVWLDKGDYARIQVLELLFVKGMANRDVAKLLNITEQHVANVRFAAVKKLSEHVRQAGLSADVFPELTITEG